MQLAEAGKISGFNDDLTALIHSLQVKFPIKMEGVIPVIQGLQGGNMVMVGPVSGRKTGMHFRIYFPYVVNNNIIWQKAVQLKCKMGIIRTGERGRLDPGFSIKMGDENDVKDTVSLTYRYV